MSVINSVLNIKNRKCKLWSYKTKFFRENFEDSGENKNCFVKKYSVDIVDAYNVILKCQYWTMAK